MLFAICCTTLFMQPQNKLTVASLSKETTIEEITELLSQAIQVEHEALSAAIKNNNFQIVQILLKNYYSNINQTDQNGNTLLMQAVLNNNIDIVRLLLKKILYLKEDVEKAVNIVNPYNGSTALILAIGLPVSSLGEITNNYGLVQFLIDMNADVNYNGFKLLGKTITPITLATEVYKTFGKKNPSLLQIIGLLQRSGAQGSNLSSNQIQTFYMPPRLKLS